jgi:hypothetical protein
MPDARPSAIRNDVCRELEDRVQEQCLQHSLAVEPQTVCWVGFPPKKNNKPDFSIRCLWK